MAGQITKAVHLAAQGPSGSGVTSGQWAALQAMVASDGTGIVTVTADSNNAILVQKADGTDVVLVDTNAGVLRLKNGFDFKVYSDDGATNKATIDAATGNVDTDGTLTVDGATHLGSTLLVDGLATLAGLTGQGTAPSLANGAALGTSPGTKTIDGNDLCFSVVQNTGTSATTGTLWTVTFATAKAAATFKVLLTALNTATGGLGLYVTTRTTTGFVIGCKTAPADSTQIAVCALVIT